MGLDRALWRLAAVVVLGTVMSILDTTIVNVAIETLGRDLGASLSSIQWGAVAGAVPSPTPTAAFALNISVRLYNL